MNQLTRSPFTWIPLTEPEGLVPGFSALSNQGIRFRRELCIGSAHNNKPLLVLTEPAVTVQCLDQHMRDQSIEHQIVNSPEKVAAYAIDPAASPLQIAHSAVVQIADAKGPGNTPIRLTYLHPANSQHRQDGGSLSAVVSANSSFAINCFADEVKACMQTGHSPARRANAVQISAPAPIGNIEAARINAMRTVEK